MMQATGVLTGEPSSLVPLTLKGALLTFLYSIRFDLPTGRLVSFSFSTEEKSLLDGRELQSSNYTHS